LMPGYAKISRHAHLMMFGYAWWCCSLDDVRLCLMMFVNRWCCSLDVRLCKNLELFGADKWCSETRMWQPRFRVLRFLTSVLLIYFNCWFRIIVLSCELVTSFITISFYLAKTFWVSALVWYAFAIVHCTWIKNDISLYLLMIT
jgi:hypothetical protein